MADVVRLMVVGSQGKADVICSLLRAFGIKCSDHAAMSVDEFPGWREIMVGSDDLQAAQELIAREAPG